MKFSLLYALPLALVFCAMPSVAAQAQGPTITYDLDVIVYCPVGTHCCPTGSDCPVASEAEHVSLLENAIDMVNTIWRPTGVSFRPNFQFIYDDRLSDIRIDGTQEAIGPSQVASCNASFYPVFTCACSPTQLCHSLT